MTHHPRGPVPDPLPSPADPGPADPDGDFTAWRQAVKSRYAAARRIFTDVKRPGHRVLTLPEIQRVIDAHEAAVRQAGRGAWLHGWERDGRTVMVGNSVRCAGCGDLLGVFTIAITDMTPETRPEPAWPFDTAACPVPHHTPAADPPPPWPAGKPRPLP